MINILFIFGTRPEIIKCAPLIKGLEKEKNVSLSTCFTGQHQDLAKNILQTFNLTPTIHLSCDSKKQNLTQLTATLLNQLNPIFETNKPDLVIVQGDTNSALAGALTAFQHKVPLAHLEAGLRSFDNNSPFPEEMNRKTISHMATYHFCSTKLASEHLKNEGITENIFVIGNTNIDALQLILKSSQTPNTPTMKLAQMPNSKLILVTIHRRESMGIPIENMCKALINIHDKQTDTHIIFPAHPSPSVQTVIKRMLNKKKRIHITAPLPFEEFTYLMKEATVILTDSGGIQEEAPSLGTPVVVLREKTERTELIESGLGKLAGFSPQKIEEHTLYYLTHTIQKKKNPFGNGNAAQLCIDLLKKSNLEM